MAKKQTRRSISVSRTTYERLKAFCESNNISMSQLVETRVNDFLGDVPAGSAGLGGLAGVPSGALTMPSAGVALPHVAHPGHLAHPGHPARAGLARPAMSSAPSARPVDPRLPNHATPPSTASNAAPVTASAVSGHLAGAPS